MIKTVVIILLLVGLATGVYLAAYLLSFPLATVAIEVIGTFKLYVPGFTVISMLCYREIAEIETIVDKKVNLSGEEKRNCLLALGSQKTEIIENLVAVASAYGITFLLSLPAIASSAIDPRIILSISLSLYILAIYALVDLFRSARTTLQFRSLVASKK